TVPCMAPEAALGGHLDQRTDVFGLGALAYFVLTGEHAFPARRVPALLEAHRRRPRPPSELSPWVSQDLEDLVLGMITLEPLGRPSSAVEVIDRLDAVGGLERAPELDLARGYLASARMVGRVREMSVARARIYGAARGVGRSIVIR